MTLIIRNNNYKISSGSVFIFSRTPLPYNVQWTTLNLTLMANPIHIGLITNRKGKIKKKKTRTLMRTIDWRQNRVIVRSERLVVLNKLLSRCRF